MRTLMQVERTDEQQAMMLAVAQYAVMVGDPHLAIDYIRAAEHQDGTGYWDQFIDEWAVVADFKRYCLHCT